MASGSTDEEKEGGRWKSCGEKTCGGETVKEEGEGIEGEEGRGGEEEDDDDEAEEEER